MKDRRRWRVYFEIPKKTHALCEIWGMTSLELARYAIQVMLAAVDRDYGSVETLAVAHALRTEPDWISIAESCDDFQEFRVKADQLGITKTPRGGVKLSDKRIVASKLHPIIRATRKGTR